MNTAKKPIAFLFADRSGKELGALARRTCPALLPIAGKPCLQYSIESLATAGISDIRIVVSAFADQVEKLVGGGERWGVSIVTLLSRGEADPDDFLQYSALDDDQVILVLRGDILRDVDYLKVLSQGEPLASPCRFSNGKSDLMLTCGSVRQLRVARQLGNLSWPQGASDLEEVIIADAKVVNMQDITEYYHCNQALMEDNYPNLRLDSREIEPTIAVGIGARFSPDSIKGKHIMVGRNCDVDRSAELLDHVILSSDIVVDRKATIKNSVILPNSYIGDMVNVENAVVWGNTMIDIETGAELSVVDNFLLSDLRHPALATGIGNVLHRLTGLFALLASLPLWPLAALLTLFSRGTPLRRTKLRGNGDSRFEEPEFVVFEWNTSAPALRFLPWLFAVIKGHIRMIGVSALTPEQDDSRKEEWERVRDEAPVGLLGPTQLTLPVNAPMEERLLTDAWYARQRSPAADIRLLLAGLAKLFTTRAWRASPTVAPYVKTNGDVG